MNSSIDTCFVIAPFKEPFDAYFSRIIKPAIEDVGLYAVRGDSLYRPSSIVDDIWQGIQTAHVLIAELTERNANVFYELGLAHALSKPVILLSQTIDDVPFDLRGIRVILYDKDDPDWGSALRGSLSKALREVLDNPLDAIPSTFKVPVHVARPREDEVLLRIERLEQHFKNAIPSLEDLSWLDSPEMKSQELQLGDIVVHKKFGQGVVKDLEGRGEHQRTQVNFKEHGLKWLVPKYAGLQIRARSLFEG